MVSTPMKSKALHEVGVVENLTMNRVVGWLKTEYVKWELFVEINGIRTTVYPRFYPRADLTTELTDGTGFEAYFENQHSSFEARVGVARSKRSNKKVPEFFLKFKDQTRNFTTVVSSGRSVAVLSAAEISKFADAIDADSDLYYNFIQDFGDLLDFSNHKLDVLFIDGTRRSSSIRYRILNIADGLKEFGYRTRYASLDQVSFDVLAALETRVVVFFRAPLDDIYSRLVEIYRSRGSRIVYDYDDLIIDERLLPKIDGVRFLSFQELLQYRIGIELYRRFAQEADVVTTSTHYLADYSANLLKRSVHVIKNTIGKMYLQHYAHIQQQRTSNSSDDFVIGYYSGSLTHQKDFSQIVKPIVEFMIYAPNSVLRIIGQLKLDEFPALRRVQRRITLIDSMPYHEMIADISNCDVVLAPLECGNEFCEAKSELKFFESALCRRPCIASPTSTFRQATNDGQYGLLANTSSEWLQALKDVYLMVRPNLAEEAFNYVTKLYSYKEAAIDAESIYFNLHTPSRRQLNVVERSGSDQANTRSIGLIVPEVTAGSGGMRKILLIGQFLIEEGYVVRLHVMSNKPLSVIRAAVRSYVRCDFDVNLFDVRALSDDALICTHWTTAYALREYACPRRVIYFIQDYEPMFSPVSSDYVKALATYEFGFQMVTYGRWVNKRLHAEMGKQAFEIPITIDKKVYRSSNIENKSIDILFYARPTQPRRCFELGVEALRIVYRDNPLLRIGLFGESDYGELGFPYTSFGSVTHLSKLAVIYQSSVVGMCFSTTNPSLVGYEMVACGLPLIDLKTPGWEHNFGGDRFVYYALPTGENIAREVTSALSSRRDRMRRIRDGLLYVDAMPEDSMIGKSLLELARTVLLED